MADMTKPRGDTAPEESSGGGIMTPPKHPAFDGDVKSVKVTGDVNTIQLLDEIEEHLGDRERYQVLMEMKDPRASVSDENPLVIHVHPATTDMEAVLGVVNSHTADADYGKTKKDKELESLKGRLAKGDLALEDLNKIVRSLIG
jgi:hypothetical protein